MEWINVEERLPQKGKVVLCTDYLSNFLSLGRLIDQNDYEYRFQLMIQEDIEIEIDTFITHWMELPKIPLE